MDSILKNNLLSALSSNGLTEDQAATLVEALEKIDQPAQGELASLLVASPALGKGLWEAAREKAKDGDGTAEEMVEKEIKIFQEALSDLA